MAELPEIIKYSRQMNETLSGQIIQSIILNQEKCANVPASQFNQDLADATITKVTYKGKWFLIWTDQKKVLLLSPGMGADIFYYKAEQELPEKYQINLQLKTGDGFTVRFWWFGKFYLIPESELHQEKHTKDIAIDPLDPAFTYDHFHTLCKSKRTQVKTFILNQKLISGIGNVYAHEILFTSKIHPQTSLPDLSAPQIKALYNAIQTTLKTSLQKGGLQYEKDFYGNEGGQCVEDFQIAYQENKPCPACNTPIQLIKTGSTSTYICPACQKL